VCVCAWWSALRAAAVGCVCVCYPLCVSSLGLYRPPYAHAPARAHTTTITITATTAANGLSDKVTVIRGKVEEVVLPEKVDVIVSEPMGFMLVHERMLESYIAARDLFLKPGGLMMPTTGTVFMAPFSDRALYAEQVRTKAAADGRAQFSFSRGGWGGKVGPRVRAAHHPPPHVPRHHAPTLDQRLLACETPSCAALRCVVGAF
jgi:hypothetical protein